METSASFEARSMPSSYSTAIVLNLRDRSNTMATSQYVRKYASSVSLGTCGAPDVNAGSSPTEVSNTIATVGIDVRHL